ncbi:DUF3152 domain-containing protein [Ruania suaedae]|uniref:DUF3152 domain-containing protein n=1 Tax=Ruania suaedae TaxID=2897774 RepID=UPI001E41C286|nr:DUF3152 domain-containing protein [Ruania suaedae]UFU03944.1 DUF3152 domain-containing protein [Ruania suaedae]
MRRTRSRPRAFAVLAAVVLTAIAVVLAGGQHAAGPQLSGGAVDRSSESSRGAARPPSVGPPRVADAGPELLADAGAAAPSPSPTATPSPTPTLTAREEADLAAGVLDREVPASASGELTVVPGEVEAPQEAQRTITVRVEVEEGLAIDGEVFGEFVITTLNDPRGWGHDGSVTFARTDGEAEMRVVLASPDLTDRMCLPLRTVGEYSCGRDGHAVLNAVRWAEATEAFLAEASITDYRHYLVTHEVGHLLGYQHRDCAGAGERAHVMQQQTISLQGCRPNGWVAP